MNASILIPGFGVITEKLALAEIKWFAAEMQKAMADGNMTRAILMMKSMRPFVEALKAKGYAMEQILPTT
jgi:hypothetical protein